MAEEGKERRKIPARRTEIPRRPTEESGLTLNSRNMFRVFRLRSGRDSPTPPFPLCLPLSSSLLLMMCPRNAERDFISLHRAPSISPFSSLSFSLAQSDLSFRFDSRTFPQGYHRALKSSKTPCSPTKRPFR